MGRRGMGTAGQMSMLLTVTDHGRTSTVVLPSAPRIRGAGSATQLSMHGKWSKDEIDTRPGMNEDG